MNFDNLKTVTLEGVLETLIAKQVTNGVWQVWMQNGSNSTTYNTQELKEKIEELKNKGWKLTVEHQ